MIFDVSPDSVTLFATLPNGDQTNRYECRLSVCSNPTCRCRSVYLTFVAQPPKGGQRDGQTWKAGLDLDITGVYPEFRRTASQGEIAFSERLVAEMDAHDFRLLGHLHFTLKNQITEDAKPDTIDPHFDFTAVESSSSMQVYTTFFRSATGFLSPLMVSSIYFSISTVSARDVTALRPTLNFHRFCPMELRARTSERSYWTTRTGNGDPPPTTILHMIYLR
jgi:hypothetical protein